MKIIYPKIGGLSERLAENDRVLLKNAELRVTIEVPSRVVKELPITAAGRQEVVHEPDRA
jgi:hypothetical protein